MKSKTHFYGEPVSYIVLFYLNLILQVLGHDDRVVKAFVKAIRTINNVTGVAVPKKYKTRPGKKERLRIKHRKAGIPKQPSKTEKERLQRRKEKRKIKQEALRKSNKAKLAALGEMNMQVQLSKLKDEIRLLQSKLNVEQKVKEPLKEFKPKPCLSCVLDCLGMKPCPYAEKHFVEKNAYCFKKNDIKFSVAVQIRSVEITVLGYKPVYVGLPKFYSFLIQYSVIPHYNPVDRNITEVVLSNMKLALKDASLADHLIGFRQGINQSKQIVQSKNVKMIENCYSFIVASLFSSIEKVGLPDISKKTSSLVEEKLQVVTSGRTVPETPNPLGGIESIKPKSTTVLAVPVITEQIVKPMSVKRWEELFVAPVQRVKVQPLGPSLERSIK
jgi:hypothetical protein